MDSTPVERTAAVPTPESPEDADQEAAQGGGRSRPSAIAFIEGVGAAVVAAYLVTNSLRATLIVAGAALAGLIVVRTCG
jgi:hypothetical protein